MLKKIIFLCFIIFSNVLSIPDKNLDNLKRYLCCTNRKKAPKKKSDSEGLITNSDKLQTGQTAVCEEDQKKETPPPMDGEDLPIPQQTGSPKNSSKDSEGSPKNYWPSENEPVVSPTVQEEDEGFDIVRRPNSWDLVTKKTS